MRAVLPKRSNRQCDESYAVWQCANVRESQRGPAPPSRRGGVWSISTRRRRPSPVPIAARHPVQAHWQALIAMSVESLHSDQAERMHWLAQCQANAVPPTPFAIITVVVSHNSVMKAATDELPSGVICISKPPNERMITCGEESRNGKMEEETKCANTVVMHDRNPSQPCTRHMRKALERRE